SCCRWRSRKAAATAGTSSSSRLRCTTARTTASSTASRCRRNVSLEKYNPLDRILFHDDFDEGINGWCELVGNHGGDLDRIRPAVADLRPPQLSSATFFDIGTHGALDGTYSLKLATRPKAGHQAVAIKRLTSQARG